MSVTSSGDSGHVCYVCHIFRNIFFDWITNSQFIKRHFSKGILLIFSYIVVVTTGHILLISTYPTLKARKMKSIASSSIFANLFKNYFRVQKYGGFLLNCTKVSLTVLSWSSQQSTLWVDFKVEFVLQSRRKKILYIYS